MVNNDGKAISDSWIGLRGKKIAQRLTQEYKLSPALEKNLKLTNLEALNQSEATKYQIYVAISENLPLCRTMEDLENRLLKLGIETQYKYKGQTSEKQGVSFKKDNVCFKGSQVDRKFSLYGLEKTLEIKRKQSLSLQQKQQLDLLEKLPRSKLLIRKSSNRNIFGGIGKDPELNLTKGLEKTLEILLKPEHTDEKIPFELKQKEAPQSRKKHSLGLNR